MYDDQFRSLELSYEAVQLTVGTMCKEILMARKYPTAAGRAKNSKQCGAADYKLFVHPLTSDVLKCRCQQNIEHRLNPSAI